MMSYSCINNIKRCLSVSIGVAVTALSLAVAPAALAGRISPPPTTPGSLDTTFDTDGKVLTDFGGTDEGSVAAIQPDGKIVAAGRIYNTLTPIIARYNTNGSLDTTFGIGGKVTGLYLGSYSNAIAAIAIQATATDSKIVIAGSNGGHFGLARFNSNGTPDSSFGVNGVVSFDPYVTGLFWDGDWVEYMKIQSDGKIVVTGRAHNGQVYTGCGGFCGGPYTISVMSRFNADGSVDTHFGNQGVVALPDIGDALQDLAIQNDGEIVATGWTTVSGVSQAMVRRYNPNGTLDSTFGSGGMAPYALPAGYLQKIALQGDGKILIASNSWTLARLNTNGSADSTFGSNGIAGIANPNPFPSGASYGSKTISGSLSSSLAVQGDGKIVIVGYVIYANQVDRKGYPIFGDYTDTGLVRLNANGSYDTTFGSGGIVISNLSIGNSYGNNDYNETAADLLVQTDGKLVVFGTAKNTVDSDFSLARFLP